MRKFFEYVGVLSTMYLLFVGFIYIPDLLTGKEFIPGSLARIQSSDVLNILTIVLTMVGIVGYGIYVWISNDIKNVLITQQKQERYYTTGLIHTVLANMSEKLYHSLYDKRTRSKDPDGKAKAEIDAGLQQISIVMREFKHLNVEENIYEALVNQNNYAYFLSLKWNYLRDGMSDTAFRSTLEKENQAKEYCIDKRLAKEALSFVDGNIGRIDDNNRRQRFAGHVEDTKLCVEKVFSVDPKVTASI